MYCMSQCTCNVTCTVCHNIHVHVTCTVCHNIHVQVTCTVCHNIHVHVTCSRIISAFWAKLAQQWLVYVIVNPSVTI